MESSLALLGFAILSLLWLATILYAIRVS